MLVKAVRGFKTRGVKGVWDSRAKVFKKALDLGHIGKATVNRVAF